MAIPSAPPTLDPNHQHCVGGRTIIACTTCAGNPVRGAPCQTCSGKGVNLFWCAHCNTGSAQAGQALQGSAPATSDKPAYLRRPSHGGSGGVGGLGLGAR